MKRRKLEQWLWSGIRTNILFLLECDIHKPFWWYYSQLLDIVHKNYYL